MYKENDSARIEDSEPSKSRRCAFKGGAFVDDTHSFALATRASPHLLIILNRQASQKRLDRFRDVLALLRTAGCTFEVKETLAAGDAARYAAHATLDTVDAVVVAGGDGTINDAINGFSSQTPPLGLIPLGTANVLAHELGLTRDPHVIAATLTDGRNISVVPGQINGRRFMMMASMGFDAHVVDGINPEFKRRVGKIAYAFEALRQLWRYPCPSLTVSIDGNLIAAATLVVSRGSLYGGRFVIAPSARLEQPELHVSLFRREGRLAMAGYSAALPLGVLNRWKLIDHMTARSVEVSCRAGDPVQADGDVVSCLPAVIGLAAHPILVKVPWRPLLA